MNVKKNDILKLFDTLEECINRIIYCANESFEIYLVEILEKLDLCQKAIIVIKKCMVSYEKYNSKLVILLEKLLVDISKLNIYTTDINVFINEIIYIKEIITEIKSILINSIPDDKKEIVFFPYKASMWDSMESIWIAAQNDSACRVSVVPIPYFDKNEDGTLRYIYYEGDKFPAYVPTVNWEKYELDKIKPDIAYIHNPYDDMNYVTSVHPKYYSYELKKYVSKLVYVPYYVTGMKLPKSHSLCSAYKYCDVIITQFDEHKKTISKFIDANKIYTFGNPKIEYLYKCNKNKKVSTEWKKIINGRRVFFLNTSISNLLTYSSACLDKILGIFKSFSEFDDMILLWRPHPLVESTLYSMRPSLVEKYKSLKKYFIENEIGILDTSSDIDMSVAISEAYIGETSSSVVCLFQALNKPCFFLDFEHNFDLKQYEIYTNTAMFSYCKVNKDIYYVNAMYAMLQVRNNKSKKVENIGAIPNEVFNVWRSYSQITYYNDKLFMTPFSSKEIAIYDLRRKVFEKIKLNKPTNMNFNTSFVYKNYLYMIPFIYSDIVRLDMDTNEIKYLKTSVGTLNKKDSENNDIAKFFNGCIVGENIYLPSAQSNEVFEFSLIEEKVKKFVVGKENENFWGIEFDGKKFWLNPNESADIVIWNKNSNKFKYVLEHSVDKKNKDEMLGKRFIKLIYIKNFIYAIPKTSKKFLKINCDTEIVEEEKIDFGYKEGARKNESFTWLSNYYFAKVENDEIVMMSSYDNRLIRYNCESNRFLSEYFRISMSTWEEISKNIEFLQKDEENFIIGCYESPFCYLNKFLKKVINGNFKEDLSESSKWEDMQGCGERIHKFLMKN